ncbi:hypothetical protein BJX63DRAFT_379535 [Aspergillus granulosus]|uniref:Secreted protein n=1 Tax=Aspergillus granulosus TaxID=176169 RepID=A0ABR4I0A0_9EURO
MSCSSPTCMASNLGLWIPVWPVHSRPLIVLGSDMNTAARCWWTREPSSSAMNLARLFRSFRNPVLSLVTHVFTHRQFKFSASSRWKLSIDMSLSLLRRTLSAIHPFHE